MLQAASDADGEGASEVDAEGAAGKDAKAVGTKGKGKGGGSKKSKRTTTKKGSSSSSSSCSVGQSKAALSRQRRELCKLDFVVADEQAGEEADAGSVADDSERGAAGAGNTESEEPSPAFFRKQAKAIAKGAGMTPGKPNFTNYVASYKDLSPSSSDSNASAILVAEFKASKLDSSYDPEEEVEDGDDDEDYEEEEEEEDEEEDEEEEGGSAPSSDSD